MKKSLSIILSLIMLFSAFPVMSAYAVTFNDFELSLKSDGTYEVTGYSGNNAGLNIPEAYNGIPITSIGVSAFNGYTTEYYNQVITPKSLKSIGEAAFYFADSLNNVVLNEGLESIGDNAFDSCKLLTKINLPSTLKTLGNDVFADDVMLSKITVNEGGKYFSSDSTALYNADKTKLVKYPSAAEGDSYKIPYTVNEISASAFTQMRYLKELKIPLSVTKIGAKAFSNDNAEYNYSITDIYFLGTEEEWNKITVESGNDILDSVTVHYTPEDSEEGEKEDPKEDPKEDSKDDSKEDSKDASKDDTKPSESAVKKITVKKPKLKKVMRVKGKKRVVKAFWSKIKGISGFEIQFSTSKKFKKSKTKTYRIKKSKTKKAFKKLKRKKKYYVRIRAYKTVKGEKHYSNWSNIKTVKTK